MKRHVHKTMAVILLLIASATAQNRGTYVSGNQLHDFCKAVSLRDGGHTLNSYQYEEASLCVGYIQGVADAQDTDIPDHVKADEVVHVVIKFLEAHPDSWHYNAASVVLAAFRDAYPKK